MATSSTVDSLITKINTYIDDYYPTLAEGNMIINQTQGHSDAEDIAETLDCSVEDAQSLIDSTLIEMRNYETTNPENDNHTLYLRTISVV